jgi:tetratricopeptide (TPR) repeat protein
VREHDYRKADSLQRIIKRPTTDTLQMKVMEAVYTQNRAREEELYREYSRQKRLPVAAAYQLGKSGYADYALRYARLNAQLAQPVERERAMRVTGFMHLLNGQMSDAVQQLSGSQPSSANTQVLAELAAFHWMPVPRDALLRIRADFARTDSAASPSGSDPMTVLADQFKAYALAMVACHLGENGEAMKQAARIDSLSAPPYWSVVMHALAEYARARVDLNEDRPDKALARLERLPEDVPLDLLPTPADRFPERLLRADLLLRAGRVDEAIAIYENYDENYRRSMCIQIHTCSFGWRRASSVKANSGSRSTITPAR